MTAPRLRPLGFAALVVSAAALAAASAPADVVIFKDGFVIQGKVRKEKETITDKATGRAFDVPRAAGFDFLDDGPRLIVFSSHAKQVGAVETDKNAHPRPEYKAYTRPLTGRKNNYELPAAFVLDGPMPDFNDKGRRALKVITGPNEYTVIEQQVTYLDPYTCFIASPNFLWTQTFRTAEMDPAQVRRLLVTHPELAEKDGQADPVKRVAVARFLKDVGWFGPAKDELDRLKRDLPGPYPKDAQAAVDAFDKELKRAAGERAVGDAEKALAGGRYDHATDLLAAVPKEVADPKELDRLTKLTARIRTARQQHDDARRLLRRLIDQATGFGAVRAFAAVGGAAAVLPGPAADPGPAALAAAAEAVRDELHPDSVGRVEFFVDLARTAEKEGADGKPPSKSVAELLAAAVTGWARGKAGTSTSPEAARRVWAAREAVLAYQRGVTRNDRAAVLAAYKREYPLGVDELVAVIERLPPSHPEDLAARTGTPVKAGGVPDRVYRYKTPSYNEHPAGIDYCVRLPPEYHHGRAYPVLVVLTYPGLDPEQMLASVAYEADRNGYILLAPAWTGGFGQGKRQWEWKGEDHDFVLGPLRDAGRRFTVDTDRVFLVGLGEGADMALDVGASHPDLFAGVVPVNPAPRYAGQFVDYWRNAQKLPVYAVSGQLAGEPNKKLRLLYEPWMRNGFPALHVMYKGRGPEWFPAETPVFFDWMGRKQRANGTATLRLGPDGRAIEWRTFRPSDDRFYWLRAEEVDPRHLTRPGANVAAAQLSGDIRDGNQVVVRTFGVRKVSVWLGRDMIDWARPVKVSVNGMVPPEGRAKVLTPDMGVLLEDYYERGDRRMLYLARLEFVGQ